MSRDSGDALIFSGPSQGTRSSSPDAAQASDVNRLMYRLLVSERMSLLGQSTAHLAHHLTNQLSVLPLIQLMEREYSTDPQLAEFLSVLRESFHQIAETVQQIRRMVRFESVEASASPLPLGDSVREVTSFLRHRKGFPWNRLRLDLRGDAVVMSSRTRLHHVLVNLLSNAADAIAGRDDGRILIRLSKNQKHGVIEVADNGPGIPASLLEKVWEPTYSTKPESIHGLGLTLVKHLVEGDGGQVGCRSVEGQQTVFAVQFPLARFEGGLDDATPCDALDTPGESMHSLERLATMLV